MTDVTSKSLTLLYFGWYDQHGTAHTDGVLRWSICNLTDRRTDKQTGRQI